MAKSKKGKTPQAESLLVELLTEELPPKSLARLGRAFEEGIYDGLILRGLLIAPSRHPKALATPRRLAVQVPNVLDMASDQPRDFTGPSVKAPPEAVAGFAKKHGTDVKALEQRDTPKGRDFVANVTLKGAALDAVLAEIVVEALKKLPIPKIMRWGTSDAQFVRPVHGLVMLHGSRIVPGRVLGLESGNRTRGHRFMSSTEIVLGKADTYEKKLLDEGKVLVDFEKRKDEIDRQFQAEAKKQNASLGEYQVLLDEVAALVEHPSVYVGEFDKAFLEVPPECLILTMRQNQKYFPLFDAGGKLLPKFLIVSNMKVADPRHIVTGNQRVVRPRLEDARFFYNQDRKQRLEERIPQLAKVVYHNKLGSQLDRVQRIKLLAGKIARLLGADALQAERAAELAKADLLTGLVGEFPELQGIMGRYYALHDKEPAAVADAIEAHYRPRFAGDRLPEGPVACAVALADKLDALVGLFGIGEQPTGEKDPFGLRRQALGVLRILLEKKLALPLPRLLEDAAAGYKDLKILGSEVADVRPFMMERLRNLLREQGYEANEIESVISQAPDRIDLVQPRLEAVRAFRKLPQAESLST